MQVADISDKSKLRTLERELPRWGRDIVGFVDEDGAVCVGNLQPVKIDLGNGFAVVERMQNPWEEVSRRMPVSRVMVGRRRRWHDNILQRVRMQRAMEKDARAKARRERNEYDAEEARRVIDEVLTIQSAGIPT